MRSKRRWRACWTLVTFPVLLMVGCSGTQQSSPEAGADVPEPDEAAVVAEEWLASLVASGFRGAVAVVEGEEAMLARGFGDLHPGVSSDAIDVDTRFDIGSLTKDFVDVSLLLLRDRGMLDLDQQIGDLLPGVPEHYSNSGYTLLAAVIEDVSGRAFDDFLRQEVFDPAGMDATGFKGEPLPGGLTEAAGYTEDGRLLALSERPQMGWTLTGNGGVVSTVADLLAFDQALCDGRIVPAELVEQIGYCGPSGAFGTAGAGSEYSHTALLEKDMDHGITIVVLSAGWEHSAEEVGLALLDHLVDADPLPDAATFDAERSGS